MYRELADDYARKTGRKVDVTPLAWGNFATKYFTAMAAGLPPDIGVTNLGGPFDYGTVGGLVDLRAEFPDEVKGLEGMFPEKLLGMFTVGDKLYGLPSDLSTLTLTYRTDIFAKLNLTPPKTWSELNATIGKLEANGYRYYFGWTAGAQWSLGLFTIPYGLPSMGRGSDGKPVVNWDEPDYQKGVMEAMRLWHMHDSPGRDLGSRVLGMFRSNKVDECAPLLVDLHTGYLGIQQDAPELDGKWAVAPWPKADDGKAYNVMGGTTYVIFRKSTMKREAMEWLKYLMSDEAQQAMVLNRFRRTTDPGLAVPATKTMWEPQNEAFWNQPEMERIRPLVGVVREAYGSFETVQQLHGSSEAGRLEANLLDQMGTYIRDEMVALASSKGLSRSQLIRDFGAGKYAADKQALEKKIADKLRAGYAAIRPQALALLNKEEARYQARYGDLIDKLPTLEKQSNVLDVMKGAAVALFLISFLTVVGNKRYRKYAVSYLFVAPPLLLALVFVFIPAAVAIFLSFTDYHPVLPLSTAKWVGGENYGAAFASGDLINSLARTARYAITSLPPGIVIALLFAYLLNNKLRGQKFWRFLYFSPLVTSVVSVALIFTQLFLGGKQGWLNALLMGVGAVRDPVPFLTSEHSFLGCVITLAIWHGLAFTTLVFLAGLQQIPDALYEAAAMDGAGPMRRFWNIALPGLRPQMFFVTVLGLIGSFQVFETIYTLAGKSGDAGARFGPNDSALTMVPLIYHTGFETFEMGKSAAIAYILFGLILIFTIFQVTYYRKKENQS